MREPRIININGKDYAYKLTYKDVLLELPKRGIYVLKLFEGDNIVTLLQQLMMDSQLVMDILMFDVLEMKDDKEENLLKFATILDNSNTDIIEEFRKILWEEIVNFTPVQMRKPLKSIYQQMEEKLGNLNLEEMMENSQLSQLLSSENESSNTSASGTQPLGTTP